MKIQGTTEKRGVIIVSIRHSKYVFEKWLENVDSVRSVTRLRNATRSPLNAETFQRVKELHAKAKGAATTVLNTTSETKLISTILSPLCISFLTQSCYSFLNYLQKYLNSTQIQNHNMTT